MHAKTLKLTYACDPVHEHRPVARVKPCDKFPFWLVNCPQLRLPACIVCAQFLVVDSDAVFCGHIQRWGQHGLTVHLKGRCVARCSDRQCGHFGALMQCLTADGSDSVRRKPVHSLINMNMYKYVGLPVHGHL
jgi:hypothetical protein